MTPRFNNPDFRAGVAYAMYQLGFAVGEFEMDPEPQCCRKGVRKVATKVVEVLTLDEEILQ